MANDISKWLIELKPSDVKSISKTVEQSSLTAWQIREVLDSNWLLNNLSQLSYVIEQSWSLSLIWDDDESSTNFLMALSPDEVSSVINLSKKIFDDKLILPEFPFDRERIWDFIKVDKLEIRFLYNKNSGVTVIKRLRQFENSDWKIEWYFDIWDRSIDIGVWASYIYSILNSNKDPDWKIQSLNSIWIELIAFVAKECPLVLGKIWILSNELRDAVIQCISKWYATGKNARIAYDKYITSQNILDIDELDAQDEWDIEDENMDDLLKQLL